MKVLLTPEKYSLQQLEAFVEVGRRLNFTQASEALHMTQPTLSGLIRQLEEAMGASLFERSTRHVQLTHIGRAMLPSARRLVQEAEQLSDDLGAVLHSARTQLRIGALASVLGIEVPHLIRQFMLTNPAVGVSIKDLLSEDSIELLRTGRIDLAVVTHIEDYPDLECIPISERRIALLLPPDHPLTQLHEVSCELLLKERIIAPYRESSMSAYCLRLMSEHGIDLRPVARVTETAAAAAMVHAGLGVALMSESSAQLVHSGILQIRPLVNPVMARPVVVARRKEEEHPKAVQAFWETVLRLQSV